MKDSIGAGHKYRWNENVVTAIQPGCMSAGLRMEARQLEPGRLNHLTPLEAWRLLQTDASALLIDIRSDMEYLFVGHPVGAVHVPWISEPSWSINQHFVTEVRKLLPGINCRLEKDCPPVILICRSGRRSIDAGLSLLEEGINYVCNVAEGFEGELNSSHQRSSLGGWRFCGLPWEQC